jgi:rubredoxin
MAPQDSDPSLPSPLSSIMSDPPMIELAEDETDAELTDPSQMAQYECRTCGYIYEPTQGDPQNGIAIGVPFEDLPKSWRCPICRAPQNQFVSVGVKGKPSGFKQNLNYGLGVNLMTPDQKNIFIFLGLALAFLFLISFYFVQ